MLNMKTAKSVKITLLITAMAMFVCSLLCQVGIFSAFAASTITPSNYFTFTSKETSKFDYVENLEDNYQVNGNAVEYGVLSAVKAGDVVGLKNKVVVDDLGVKLVVDQKISKFTVLLKASSYDVNGNRIEKDDQVEFDKQIVTEYQVASNGMVNLEFGVTDGYITVTEVAGGTKNAIADTTDSYFKIRHVDKTAVELSFRIDEVASDEAVDFVITDINQKVSAGYVDNDYNQSFKLNAEKNAILETALPRIALADSFFTNTQADLYQIIKMDGDLYTVDMTVYGVVKATSMSNIFLSAGSLDANGFNMTVNDETNSKRIIFNLKTDATGASMMSFHVSTKVGGVQANIETYDVKVVQSDVENKAPEYKDVSLVSNQVESFQKALDIASKKNGHSLNLGDKITVPSLENFITDDYSSFNKLSKTIHLVTPSNQDKTSTSSSIQLDEIGTYKLYVTFKDENGASMDKEDFYSDDPTETPKYSDFVFTITINDDADLLVNPEDQDDGYVGIVYKASPFDIVASGYTTEYTLYYNSDLNAKADSAGWKQIRTLKDYRANPQGDYTEEELEYINYNGELTFRPDKIGSYKINCYISSEKSYRDAEGDTIIRIALEPTPVKPANNWLKENVWSVVFLSVGTLCLVAIVVLLFIKPKDAE